jgi:hypothetical protein
MTPNPDPQNQPTKPVFDRVPAPVLAALVTGVFALITTLAATYFPNKTRMDELHFAATQTAESRALDTTQAAGATMTLAPGTAQAPGSAITATATLTASPTATATQVLTATASVTASPTATATQTLTATAQPSATATKNHRRSK